MRQTHSFETDKEVAWQIYHWQHRNDSFYSQLFSLFCKADQINIVRLGMGFPTHFEMFLEWREMGEKDFFNKYGINTTSRELL